MEASSLPELLSLEMEPDAAGTAFPEARATKPKGPSPGALFDLLDPSDPSGQQFGYPVLWLLGAQSGHL